MQPINVSCCQLNKNEKANHSLCILFCVNACTKNEADTIFIRVENSTSQNFKEVIVNNKFFTNVEASGLTSYQSYESALSIPTATLITSNNDTIYAGLLYIDWLEHLENGKYTLKTFEDSTTTSGFNCEYIKN